MYSSNAVLSLAKSAPDEAKNAKEQLATNSKTRLRKLFLIFSKTQSGITPADSTVRDAECRAISDCLFLRQTVPSPGPTSDAHRSGKRCSPDGTPTPSAHPLPHRKLVSPSCGCISTNPLRDRCSCKALLGFPAAALPRATQASLQIFRASQKSSLHCHRKSLRRRSYEKPERRSHKRFSSHASPSDLWAEQSRPARWRPYPAPIARYRNDAHPNRSPSRRHIPCRAANSDSDHAPRAD